MTHGAAHALDPALHADPALAVGCSVCNGWGSVIDPEGHHALCPACQPDRQPLAEGGD
ncbi:hypothetical protein [Streptomyces sp. NPDC093261]|uniref:hypothetical protein n=1 Tax=Streptomyces sp. NPDC093261 TaxID=3366037 RepID=UPI00381D69E0